MIAAVNAGFSLPLHTILQSGRDKTCLVAFPDQKRKLKVVFVYARIYVLMWVVIRPRAHIFEINVFLYIS